MAEVHQAPRRWIARTVWLLAAVVWGYVAVGPNGWLDLRGLRGENARLAAEAADLAAENAAMRTEIEAIKHDPRRLEMLARQELGMLRPDEYLVILPKDYTTTPDAGTPR